MKRHIIVWLAVLSGFSGAILAAEPPSLINLQGVLRDAVGSPLNSPRIDMVFRFYDVPDQPGGTLLLTDSRTGPYGVTVTGGLFSVHLGEQTRIIPGVYPSLADMMANETRVYPEIQVADDPPMVPRMRIVSAAFALNAHHLAGRPASGFLDTSAALQIKLGPLRIGLPDPTAQGAADFNTQNAPTPTGTLQLTGGPEPRIDFGSPGGDPWQLATRVDDKFHIIGGPVGAPRSRLTLQASGEVGIGTEFPTEKLEVAGNAKVTGVIESTTGGVRFPDGSLQTRSAIGDLCMELTGTSACDAVSAIRYVAFVNWTTPLDEYGSGGTSIAIGTDGNPVISYFDGTNADLKVAKCNDSTCGSPPALSTVENGGTMVGEFNSMAIGTDGNPVISYFDDSNNDLKVAKCSNPACTTATLSTVDGPTSGLVGKYTSIAIGTDGNPIISYFDGSNYDLKVAKCSNPTCTTATRSTLDSFGVVGEYTSIAVGTDGNPVISYFDSTNRDLKVAKCSNPACTTAALSTLDSAGDVGSYTSIIIGTDGNPVISYYDSTNRDLKVAKCSNPACTTATLSTVDSTGDVGSYTSIAVGTDGNPVISYYDSTNRDLKVAKCNDSACASPPMLLTMDNAGDVGSYTSIAIGTDSDPVISYIGTNGLRVITRVYFPEEGAGGALEGVNQADSSAPRDSEHAGYGPIRYVHVAGIDRPGIANPDRVSYREWPIDDEGNVYGRSFRPTAPDFAAYVPVSVSVEVGDVLVLDPNHPGLMRPNEMVTDATVVGVVSGEAGVLLGRSSSRNEEVDLELARQLEEAEALEDKEEATRIRAELEARFQQTHAPVALSGIVLCKVDAGYGSVQPGDLLVTSATPGHAMRADDPMPGTVLGKALEPLETGMGRIKVLLMQR